MKLLYVGRLLFTWTLFFSAVTSSFAEPVAAPFVGNDFSGIPCHGNPRGHGPFDYLQRSRYQHDLILVEGSHFTSSVERLIKGNRSGDSPLGDINYTLRAFPNHHRALYSAIQLRINPNLYSFTDMKTFVPAECWLQRGLRFSPEDPIAHMLYGLLLHKMGKLQEAENYYNKSLSLMPNNAQTIYNLGLLMFDLKKYDSANQHAQFVYSNNYPLEGLKNKLISVGKWRPAD